MQLVAELDKLVQPVPRDQFSGLPSRLERRQEEYRSKQTKLDQLAKQCFNHADSFVEQLEDIMKSTTEAGHTVNYTDTIQ